MWCVLNPFPQCHFPFAVHLLFSPYTTPLGVYSQSSYESEKECCWGEGVWLGKGLIPIHLLFCLATIHVWCQEYVYATLSCIASPRDNIKKLQEVIASGDNTIFLGISSRFWMYLIGGHPRNSKRILAICNRSTFQLLWKAVLKPCGGIIWFFLLLSVLLKKRDSKLSPSMNDQVLGVEAEMKREMTDLDGRKES